MGYGDWWDPIGREQKEMDDMDFYDGFYGRPPRYPGQENNACYRLGRNHPSSPAKLRHQLFRHEKSNDDPYSFY
jgi:hypothetical protein